MKEMEDYKQNKFTLPNEQLCFPAHKVRIFRMYLQNRFPEQSGSSQTDARGRDAFEFSHIFGTFCHFSTSITTDFEVGTSVPTVS